MCHAMPVQQPRKGARQAAQNTTHPPTRPPTADLCHALGHGQQLSKGAEALGYYGSQVTQLMDKPPLHSSVAKVACERAWEFDGCGIRG